VRANDNGFIVDPSGLCRSRQLAGADKRTQCDRDNCFNARRIVGCNYIPVGGRGPGVYNTPVYMRLMTETNWGMSRKNSSYPTRPDFATVDVSTECGQPCVVRGLMLPERKQ
ncbi:hypothetical protein PV325_009931, partial [Microctonus aethiopoides]